MVYTLIFRAIGFPFMKVISNYLEKKVCVSKHLYECSYRIFKIMPIYCTDDHSVLQIKEKIFIDKFKPTLNRA